MIDILVIGNPTLDYIDGKFFSPGGPVTYVNNSLFQMNESSVTTITSFGEDFSEKNLMNAKNLINLRSKFTNRFDFHLSSDTRNMQVLLGGNSIKLEKIKIENIPEISFRSNCLLSKHTGLMYCSNHQFLQLLLQKINYHYLSLSSSIMSFVHPQ